MYKQNLLAAVEMTQFVWFDEQTVVKYTKLDHIECRERKYRIPK